MAKYITFNSLKAQQNTERKLGLDFNNNIYSFRHNSQFFQISDKNAELVKNDTGVKILNKLPNPEKYNWMGPGLRDVNKIEESTMKLKNVLESIIKEATFDITKDVDYIYVNGGFKKFVEDFNNQLEPYKDEILYGRDVLFKIIKSTELPSKDSKKASKIKPIQIKCGIMGGSYYNPKESEIATSMTKSGLRVIYTGDMSLLSAIDKKTLSKEITEDRIKASISHELSHWLDDVNHNNQITKLTSLANELGSANVMKLKKQDVNLTYFEIDAQIHGIKPIYLNHKKEWDEYTLEDLFYMYVPLTTIYNRVKQYGKDVTDLWQKTLIKRLNREGMLGKNMRSFVK